MVAGLGATAVMTLVQAGLQRMTGAGDSAGSSDRSETGERPGAHLRRESHPAADEYARAHEDVPRRFDRDQNERSTHEEGEESSTVKLASIVSERVFRRELPETAKPAAGNLVHYGFGTTMGGAYGALAEVLPAVTAGQGLLYGVGLMLLADEAAVPAMGLSRSPRRRPASTHAYSLVSHVVYGLTCEMLRRPLRALLGRS